MVHIDEDLCDGCGDCVPSCAEGAIQVIDGKARLISDALCDGLGACLGHCPQGAITVTQREAVDYDGAAVARHLAAIGRRPGRSSDTAQALPVVAAQAQVSACPGSRTATWDRGADTGAVAGEEVVPPSLRQWPIQLHLLASSAEFLAGADVLLVADCVAYAVGGFHRRFLDGRALAIACPKLDSHQEIYVDKLVAMIDSARIRSLTVMVMEVPCCNALVRLAKKATTRAQGSVHATSMVVGVRGSVLGHHDL
jgi:NAD-dependent dihydropyrimidine dehydrogenase PreA subunit